MGASRSKAGRQLSQAAHDECVELQRLLQRACRGNDRALHLARKSLQRLRAMVRLLHAVDPVVAKRENRRLRRLRRRLAPLRDARVRAETYSQLAAHRQWAEFDSRLVELARSQDDRHRTQWKVHAPDLPFWREALRESRLLQIRVGKWPFAQLGRKSMRRTLARALKRLRRQFDLARGTHGRGPRHLLRRRLRQAAALGRMVAAACDIEDDTPRRLQALAGACGTEGDLWMAVAGVRQAARSDESLRPLARALEQERRSLCRRNDRKLQRMLPGS